MQAIGVDIGTSSIKGAVLDLETESLKCSIARPFPAPIRGLPDGWVEIDPGMVCNTVNEVLSNLANQCPSADRIYLSGQMGGVMLLDDRARPLTNYLSWRDQRTLDPTPHGESLFEQTHTSWESSGDLLRRLDPKRAATSPIARAAIFRTPS